MVERCRAAFKEWAVICDQLAKGRQIFVVRKGGIREDARRFSVDHHRFFLFPTYTHQNEDELVDAVQATLADVRRSAPPADVLRLELFATVEMLAEVRELERLRAVAHEQALTWPAIEGRFRYRRPGLHVIALRVYRLPRPPVMPYLPRYDGCRSWVTFESEPPVTDPRPVLDDRVFLERLEPLRRILPPSPEPESRERA